MRDLIDTQSLIWLSSSMPYRQRMLKAIADLGLTELPIRVEYADVQAGLP
jgi:hypothetical protein